MTRREADELFIRTASDCFRKCMDRASREYMKNLRPHATPEELEEFEKFLKSDDFHSLQGVQQFIQSLSPSSPGESRAERLKRQGKWRKDYFQWLRKFVRRPGAGGRPEKLQPTQKATIVSRVREFLAEGATKQDAFEAAGKPFDASISTVRRVWMDYLKSRDQPTKHPSRSNRK